jgi:hypothetical protein
MKPTKSSKKEQPKAKPNPKINPKSKPKEKVIEAKWGNPEKDVPKVTERKRKPIEQKMSNQEHLDMIRTHHFIKNNIWKTITTQEYIEMGRKLGDSDKNLIHKKRAEKISTYSITASIIIMLFWLWSYSDSRNEIDKMQRINDTYQFQVDSLNQVVGDLQAHLQTSLDTIHNNSSKIPDYDTFNKNWKP